MVEKITEPKKRGRKPKAVESVEPKKRGRKPKVKAEVKKTLPAKTAVKPEVKESISVPPAPKDVIDNVITTKVDSLKENVENVIENTKKVFLHDDVKADERGWDIPEKPKGAKEAIPEFDTLLNLEHYPYREECFYEKVEPLIIPALIAGTFLNTLIIVSKIFSKNK